MVEEGVIVLYKIRWFIAAATVILQALSIANALYGIVNDVYVQYFHISYAKVDLILTGNFIGALPACPLLAWLISSKKVRLRNLMLLGTGSLTLSLLLVGSAFLDWSLFGLAATGQAIDGVTRVVAKSLPATFAVVWFPDHQVGTVLGMNIFGGAFSCILSSVLMGYIINPKHSIDNSTHQGVDFRDKYIASNLSAHKNQVSESLVTSVRSLFVYNITCASIAFLVFCFVAVFVTDRPPTPPTHAQILKLAAESGHPEGHSLKRFWKQTKQLFGDGTYVLLAFSWSVYMQANTIQLLFAGEIMRKMAVPNPYGKTSIFTISFYVGCLAGALMGGKLVDRFKNYLVTIKAASLFALITSTLVTLALALNHIWMATVCNLLFGVSARISLVSLMEIITQHTYPADEGFVNLWVVFVDVFYGIGISEVGRVVYDNLGGFAVLMLQTTAMLVGAVVAWTAKIELRRVEVERSELARLLN